MFLDEGNRVQCNKTKIKSSEMFLKYVNSLAALVSLSVHLRNDKLGLAPCGTLCSVAGLVILYKSYRTGRLRWSR